MIRKSLTTILVVALLITATSAPAAAQSLGVFGDETDVQTPSIVRYGTEGHPSYVISLTNDSDSVTSIQDWADTTESRTLVEVDNQSHTATVAAPRYIATGSILDRAAAITANPADASSIIGDTALGERSYVESVHPNYQLSKPRSPGPLLNQSGYDQPQIGALSVDDPDFSTEGIAFSDDADRTTMAESRAIIGADNVSATGSGITVAVIDTGANTANGQVFGDGSDGSDIRIDNASKSFISNESVNATGGDFDAIQDKNGHGTWVASAIAANASGTTHDGMAPDSDLLVLKALNAEGQGSTSDIASAVRYAADNDADVVSMSLGSAVWSQPLADAIEYAYDNGVQAVVVAAGNSRQTVRWVASPADVSNVITVAATNGSDNDTAESAYFSQIGPDPGTADNSDLKSQNARIDVAAPGMKTVAKVASPEGFVSNDTLSGTSMATPMVAGGIAAALETNGTLADASREEVVAAVQNSARPAPQMAAAETGHGMFAADLLATGDHPTTDQEDAMTTEAQTRDEFYEAQSDSWGGFVADLRAGASRIGS